MKIASIFCLAFIMTQPTGFQIMKKVKEAGSWKDMKGKIVLELQSSSGEKKRRTLEFYSAKDPSGLNRMLMRLVEPPEVKGMAFLFIERKGRDDERYVYLSRLRMVRKIEASGKRGSFISSDFSYYDIGGVKLEDWNFTLKGVEKAGGSDVYVIEAAPKRKDVEQDTGYLKVIYHIKKDLPLVWSAEYVNRAGMKFKEYRLLKWENPDANSYLATEFLMENLITHHKSLIKFENVEINTGIPLSFFSVRYLRRR